MLVELFKALKDEARDRIDIIDIDVSADSVERQVHVDGVAKGSSFIIDRYPPKKSHTFDTLQGFVSYLNSEHCADRDMDSEKNIVFVGGHFVTANLSYSSNKVHAAALPLYVSEEFEALQKLQQGVGQKTLWRALVTDLAECFTTQLRLAISNLDMSNQESHNVVIKETGLSEESAKRTATIVFPSQKAGESDSEKELPLDWKFVGRYRECFNHEMVVPVRIEVSAEKDKPPVFTFHCIGLPTIMRNEREAMAEFLRNELSGDRYTVHEGVEVPDETSPSAHKGFSY